jgi:putative (di)nucleoside polyphosphate hydrolase
MRQIGKRGLNYGQPTSMENPPLENSNTPSPLPHPEPVLYRPNVAAILTRSDGQILIAERLRFRGAWQFPQGGVDDGETTEAALFREVDEEIGVARELIAIRSQRGGYRYAFPKGRLKYGLYGGQEQTYFLCDFLGRDEDIDLNKHNREFGRWKWILPHEFELSWVPRFKQKVYRSVFRDFFELDL